ncbi:MAG TPA: hypothetical protein VGP82_10595 [Ktedonobacterales bacterium]|nr:hypothetical protein [Ktedonobacterales bacterium]
MFNDVGGGSLLDLEQLEDGRYFVRLKSLEDQGPQEQYAKVRDDGSTYVPRSVRWTFQLGRDINTPIYGVSGAPVEIYAWTSEAVGPKSSARPWMEALLQRSLIPGESGASLPALLEGKIAWAMIGVTRTPDPITGTVRVRPKILTMSKYTQGVPVAAAAAAPVEQQAAGNPLPWGGATG